MARHQPGSGKLGGTRKPNRPGSPRGNSAVKGRQTADCRIVEYGAITPGLASAVRHRQREQSGPSSINDSWLELICVDGDGGSNERHVIRVAAPPCDVSVGDLIDLDDTETLGMTLTSPPADLIDVGGVQLTGATELSPASSLREDEGPPQTRLLADRLDRTPQGWVAHCDRTPSGRYDEFLIQLEAMYPDIGDPTDQVTLARAALPYLREVPVVALSQNILLEPQTSRGVIYRHGRGGRFLLLPIVVLLNWGAAKGDVALIAEVEQAVNRVPELSAWADACATVRDRTEAVTTIDRAIRSTPGIKQSDLAERLEFDKELVREIVWVMNWARTVRREQEGRSYRLFIP